MTTHWTKDGGLSDQASAGNNNDDFCFVGAAFQSFNTAAAGEQ
jgi:hypothetical protein